MQLLCKVIIGIILRSFAYCWLYFTPQNKSMYNCQNCNWEHIALIKDPSMLMCENIQFTFISIALFTIFISKQLYRVHITKHNEPVKPFILYSIYLLRPFHFRTHEWEIEPSALSSRWWSVFRLGFEWPVNVSVCP